MSNDKQVNFNNPARVVQSWYVAAKSSQVKRGKVKAFNLFKRRIAIYRDSEGEVHAIEARCPHMGANLGQGKVVGNRLQCAFHHWKIGPNGQCYTAKNVDTNRITRVYPTLERWGHIWIFNGPRPLFNIPEPPKDMKYFLFKTPSQHIKCHPHMVIGNGLDPAHFDTLHGLIPTAEPKLTVSKPFGVTLEFRGHPKSSLLRSIIGTWKIDIVSRFTAIGGHLAFVEVLKPFRFYVLSTGRISRTNGCITKVFFFLPRNFRFIQAILSMLVFLHNDRKILDELEFHPGFLAEDKPMKEFYNLVNKMATW